MTENERQLQDMVTGAALMASVALKKQLGSYAAPEEMLKEAVGRVTCKLLDKALEGMTVEGVCDALEEVGKRVSND